MGIETKFKKNLDFLLSENVQNGSTTFSYLQGSKTITVSISVVEDYGGYAKAQ